MSWKKHFKPVVGVSGNYSPVGSAPSGRRGIYNNYSNYLPDVYSGSPHRIERLTQYDTMDNDSEVNAALDILAEFTTQPNKENGTHFNLAFTARASATEVTVLKEYLQKWTSIQKFGTRMFRTFRNTFKNGDSFFIRDPETFEWMYVDPSKVVKIICNESEGKKPEQYIIRDLNLNFMELVTTQISQTVNQPRSATSPSSSTAATSAGFNGGSQYARNGSRFELSAGEFAIDAKHVIHLSLSEGLDNNYPFGNSLLESVFKVYKQKELLEDAVIIYRVQRAPERRVFYIDVGNMPAHMAMGYVERVKNEIHQRRIPSATSGSTSAIDSAYNPLSIGEDYYFPQTAEGRGSKVDTLPGGCFDMNTKVPLVDGRVLSIAEISKVMENGETVRVYSIDPSTGTVAPGIVSWAGITNDSANVVKLNLSNGKSVICTPDHRFPTSNAGIIFAEDLNESHALYPLARKWRFSDGELTENVFDSYSKQWVPFDTYVSCRGLVSALLHTIYKESDPKSVYVTSVEYMDQPIEVGTLTIDKYEKEHGFHTFGLDVGIFTCNSSLGEIDDLRYFTNKLMRALRIPSSYLPTGADDSQGQFNDGRVGTAYIQELRFNKYCERLQQLLLPNFDTEFKYYINAKGVNIDPDLFSLRLQPPQNFASYRQAELDNQRIGTFSQIVNMPFISKRFALERFLGLTKEDIAENEKLWKEENDEFDKQENPEGELRGAGITPSGMSADMDMFSSDVGETPSESPEGGEISDMPVPTTNQ